MGSKGLNSGPHVCMAVTFIGIYLSPIHPLHLVFNSVIKTINETVINNECTSSCFLRYILSVSLNTKEHMKPGEDSGSGEGRNWREDLIIYF